jgi:hypothetical protein
LAIKEDLINVEGQKMEFTSISELKRIETLLKPLELRLNNFKQGLQQITLKV